ncbi:hypothetical protein [Ornithinibacillus bavariensis]|uniref:Uncharacterized protein n=1 Tax=Ornithinibacillus bavariensis TaxID=545502 RepID=A0A919X7X2_9BACI|nr:hypothetical protein [Ornithinibacillus bavariensis]GIO27439.1 hypothetical protein J43TS3_20500 [Ornithinibacillus bavariensis]
MKYSTARWLAIIFFVIGAVPISTYFYLDANGITIPFLTIIVRPVGVIAFLIATFLLLASIMASRTRRTDKKTPLPKCTYDTYLFNRI